MEVEHSPTSSYLQKYRLLLWKSFVWHRYYWTWTLIEIIIRCFVPAYLMITTNVKYEKLPVTITSVSSRQELLETFKDHQYVAYSPSTSFTDELMKSVVRILNSHRDLNATNPIELVNRSTETELLLYMVNRSISRSQAPMGIIFSSNTSHGLVPDHLVYEVRQSEAVSTRFLFSLFKIGPSEKVSEYWSGGFAAIQLVINEEFIRIKAHRNKWVIPIPTFQPFPYPEFRRSNIEGDLPDIILITSLATVAIEVALAVPLIASVISEKQSGVKELMRIHGMDEPLIWFSWFIKSFVVILISVTLATVFLKIPLKGSESAIDSGIEFSVLWTIYMLFAIANITFILFLCSIFNKATVIASVYVSLTFLCTTLVYTFSVLNLRQIAQFVSIIPSTNFLKTARFLAFSRTAGKFDWKSLTTIREEESTLTCSQYLVYFLLEIIIYSVLAWYIGSKNSSDFSKQKSSYFPLEGIIPSEKLTLSSISLQTARQLKNDKNENAVLRIRESKISEIRESIVADHQPALVVEDLSVEYGPIKALDTINVDFYENEISVLLGHQKSGKTTFVSVLTDSVSFEQGSIHYKGININDNIHALKNDLGVCFKEERLFPYMSPKQHLIFFGMLKGLNKNDADEEAEIYLTKMGIFNERDNKIKYLSVVSKRILCITIALMGERKVLLLDEPTIGLDLHSKIKMWNLLASMRSDRVIIVSSQYSKELDNLADRITVLENGVIVAHGTPSFLKKNLGANYKITISGKQENFDEIVRTVNNTVNATIKMQTEDEIVYEVPISDSPKFPELFKNLDTEVLEISNIDVTVETIEDILLKKSLTEPYSVKPSDAVEVVGSEYDSITGYPHTIDGLHLKLRQMKILFRKKTTLMVRHYNAIFARIILPTLFTLFITHLITTLDFDPLLVMEMSPSPETYIYPRIVLHNRDADEDSYHKYVNYISSFGASFDETTNGTVVQNLIILGRNNLLRFRRELIAAFSLNANHSTKILYNPIALHSLPIAITTYSNVLLRQATGNENFSITTFNHPAPHAKDGCPKNERFIKAFYVFCLMFFAFGYLTMEVVFLLFELSNKEIAEGVMHLQIMSGVPTWMYWFTTFTFDLLFFTVVIAIRVALFALLINFHGFFEFNHNFGIFLSIIFIFGVTGLFYVYIVSMVYRPVKRSYALLFVINLTCNIGVAMCYVSSLDFEVGKRTRFGMFLYLIYALLFIPFLSFPWAVLQYLTNWYYNNRCSITCSPLLLSWCLDEKVDKNYLEFSTPTDPYGILREFSFLVIGILHGGSLFIAMNMGLTDAMHNIFKGNKVDHRFVDVENERNEIKLLKEDESKYNQVPVLVDELSKNYWKKLKRITAVNDVSFIAEYGSCFGILGGHAAGKTTIFHSMATKIIPTTGEVTVNGYKFNDDRELYFSLVGYCPQISPLIDIFTGRDMLELIASLKGIEYDLETILDEWVSATGLEDSQHDKCKYYTIGNQRLLSVALSLLGNPKVVFLDEPGTGIDSLSKRHLYDIIERMKDSGKTIILGSPSPGECQLLCDRLTILEDGIMYCIGTPEELEKTHNLGFFLMIRVHPEVTSLKDVVQLQRHLMNDFGRSSIRLVEEYKSFLHYQITDSSLTLSVLFQKIENIKQRNSVIEDYIATTTTIGDIFESLARPANYFSSRNTSGSSKTDFNQE